ncbi:hypothetical protein H0H93_015107, partial [Arthromyces matolae]
DAEAEADPAAARTPTAPEAEKDANANGHVAGTPPHREPLAPPRTPSRREGSRNPSLTPPPSSQPRNTTPTRMPRTQAADQLFDDPVFDNGEGEDNHDHENENDQDEDEDESIYPHKAGRIPNEAKELAHAYQKEYFEKMEALATKYGKPVKHFYILVGDVLPPGRREVSEWGVFQSWYNSFGEKRKPANMERGAWTRVVRDEYHAFLKKELKLDWEVPELRTAVMQDKINWYHDEYARTVEAMKVDGRFSRIIAKTVAEFSNLGSIAYKYHGLHCFGFVMNLQPDNRGVTNSVMWGSSPAFVEMQ